MPGNKSLTLSIVIPVYNEESHLRACLDSIARQTVAPDEVIVIDNNSTDGSAKLVKQYSFVKLIREPKQGLIAARNRGFNYAKGDILARIDADAKLDSLWVHRLLQDFNNMHGVAGVTGYGINTMTSIYSLPIISRVVSKFYYWNTRGYMGIQVLWGSNMAIRSKWWGKIKVDVNTDEQTVHEDQDISLLIAAHGGLIYLDPKIIVNFDGARLQEIKTLREYMHRRKTTKLYHIKRGTYKSPKMRIIAWPARLFYIVLTEPFRFFFYLTSLLYTNRARKFMSIVNRQ